MLRSKSKLADSLWILLIASCTQVFILSIEKNKREKRIRRIFGKQVGKFIAKEISRTFFLICKSLHAQYCIMYFAFIPSPNFRVLKTGRMCLDYKYRQKIESFPLVLQLKRYVVVLQAMVKKCIKAHATCKARLNHLACKNTYNGIKLLNILKLNSYISRNYVQMFGNGNNKNQKTAIFASSAFVLDTTVKQVTLTSL